jgi:hypothetical protein
MPIFGVGKFRMSEISKNYAKIPQKDEGRYEI